MQELERVERTLFLLDWLQDPDLRCKVTAGLNKGGARNTPAHADLLWAMDALSWKAV